MNNVTTKTIIAINCALFAFELIMPGSIADSSLINFGALHSWSSEEWCWIQMLTYMFLHANMVHICINMIVLWGFGRHIETAIGWKRFVLLYVFCGIIAGIANNIFNIDTLVGASGAIFGIVGYYSMLYPNDKIGLFYLPIYIKAKWFIAFVLIIEVVDYLIAGTAVAAHLGGLAAALPFACIHKIKLNNSQQNGRED